MPLSMLCFVFLLSLCNKKNTSNEMKKNTNISPADVCLNFSLFFFLHFQGLRSLPRVANLLR